MLGDNPLQAFATGAGISASDLSLFIRITLLVGFFMWAAWCALQLLMFHKEHYRENIATLVSKYIQLFFLVSIVITLVFTN